MAIFTSPSFACTIIFKRPNNITGEHSFSIRKPEQIVDLLKEQGLPMPTKLMLEGDELPYTEYCRLAGLFPEAEVVMVPR